MLKLNETVEAHSSCTGLTLWVDPISVSYIGDKEAHISMHTMISIELAP